jgi:hypothetical protein
MSLDAESPEPHQVISSLDILSAPDDSPGSLLNTLNPKLLALFDEISICCTVGSQVLASLRLSQERKSDAIESLLSVTRILRETPEDRQPSIDFRLQAGLGFRV